MATTPVFWLGEFHGQRAWQATVHRVAKTQLSNFYYGMSGQQMLERQLHGDRDIRG